MKLESKLKTLEAALYLHTIETKQDKFYVPAHAIVECLDLVMSSVDLSDILVAMNIHFTRIVATIESNDFMFQRKQRDSNYSQSVFGMFSYMTGAQHTIRDILIKHTRRFNA